MKEQHRRRTSIRHGVTIRVFIVTVQNVHAELELVDMWTTGRMNNDWWTLGFNEIPFTSRSSEGRITSMVRT